MTNNSELTPQKLAYVSQIIAEANNFNGNAAECGTWIHDNLLNLDAPDAAPYNAPTPRKHGITNLRTGKHRKQKMFQKKRKRK